MSEAHRLEVIFDAQGSGRKGLAFDFHKPACKGKLLESRRRPCRAAAIYAVSGAFFAFCTTFTGVWKGGKKSVLQGLTYFPGIVRLQMVRHFLKVSSRAGDSQSGLKYSKEQIL